MIRAAWMLLAALFLALPASADSGGTTPGSSAAAVLQPAYRAMGPADDITQNHPAGAMSVRPDGMVETSQRSTAGLAWWAPGIGVGSTFTHFGQPLPCDIAATVACYGTRLLRAGYAGAALNVTRLSDGTSFDIGFVNGAWDSWTFAYKCSNDVCRLGTLYDQKTGGGGNDAVAVHAPLVLTTTGNNTFASTTGVQDGDHIEYPGSVCKVDTSVSSHTATTITANNGCIIPTGTKVMFSQAALISGKSMIGNSPAIMLDAEPGTWSITAQLSLPAGVTVGSKVQGGVMVARAVSTVRGFTYFALAQTGATGQAWSIFTNAGNTSARTFDGGSTWNTPGAAALMGGVTPHVLTWIGDSLDQAFPSPKICFDEICGNYGFASGNATLAGGYIGAGGYTNVPGGDAQMAFSAFVLYSVNPTKTQQLAAQAGAYMAFGLKPQNRQHMVLTGGDSWMQGPENSGMLNTPWQLADAVYNNGVRVINAGKTGETNANWNTNYTQLSATYQSTAKTNLAIWSASGNDYDGTTSCAAQFTNSLLPLIRKFKATGFKVLIHTTPTGNFSGNKPAYLVDCNARVFSNAAAEGYSTYDLAADAAFTGSWYSNSWQSLDGVHPSNNMSALISGLLRAATIPMLN